MFNLITGIIVLLLAFAAIRSFQDSINNTDLDAERADDTVSSSDDVILFSQLKEVALDRAAAENISELGQQVLSIKKCDEKIIDISKRIKRRAS